MAGSILIPLKTVFDDKGIKEAQGQFGKLGSSMKGLLATAGIAIGIGAITNGLKDAAKAATEDVKSQALLAGQLKNTVGATQSQTDAVEKSIQKMQLMAGVADDQIRPAFASLLRSTKDIGQATGLTSLALDVAAGTGKDLGSVSLALGKAINGSNTSLVKLIPSIKGAKDPLAELQKQFGGMAETAANADPFQRMQIIFQDIQEQVGKALLPALQELAKWLASDVGQKEIQGLVDVFVELATAVGNVITWLKDNYKAVIAIGTTVVVIAALITAFEAVTTAIEIAKAAQIAFTLAMDANPIWLAVTAIAALILALSNLNKAVGTSNPNLMGQNVPKAIEQAAAQAGTAAAVQYRKENPQDIQGAIRANKAATQEFVNRWKSGQAELARKAAADKAAQDKALADQLKDLQGAQVPVTPKTSGVNTAADAAKAKAKALADAAKKAAEEATQAYLDLKAAVDDFNKSFAKTAVEFVAVFKSTAPLGEFEQKAVDAFATIKQSAQDAFDSKLITDKALADLNKYADQEAALLQSIGKQRDVLAKKISIAQSITQGVMGSLDINSMLQSQTKTVTKSVTSIVNGIALTTTQSFDQIVTSGLADSFKKLVDKTKTFASNLIKLKALGLNGQLFKQIVDAGAETGGATAEAIIAGGADAVKELNGLFGELEKAGSSIAETATPVMYDLGDQMTNSFIDGLRSEDQKLIDTATAMAAIFTSQFQSQISGAMSATVDQAGMKAGITPSNMIFVPGIGRVTSDYLGSSSNSSVTVNVSAGVIANKQELPAIIVDALNTASKQGLSTRILNAMGV